MPLRRRGVRGAGSPGAGVLPLHPLPALDGLEPRGGGRRPGELRVHQGREVKTYESHLAPRNFCSNCGSSIYDDLGEVYFVAAGLMSDLDLKPSFHQQVAYKASWHEIGDDAPQFAEMPPG